MSDWINVEDKLPEPNQIVLIEWDVPDTVKFVTNSDDGYFWDNMVNIVYQSNEVKRWLPIPKWVTS